MLGHLWGSLAHRANISASDPAAGVAHHREPTLKNVAAFLGKGSGAARLMWECTKYFFLMLIIQQNIATENLFFKHGDNTHVLRGKWSGNPSIINFILCSNYSCAPIRLQYLPIMKATWHVYLFPHVLPPKVSKN